MQNPELLRSLGRLVRGLSALFWGLPMTLLFCVGTAFGGWFGNFGNFAVAAPLAATGLLLFGLWQLGDFQKQERPWRDALDRARLVALVNFGLSPFVYWWSRAPEVRFFGIVVCIMTLSGLVFLFNLNLVLARLGAMLPDENLRQEINQFTAFNRGLLIAPVLIAAVYLAFDQAPTVPLNAGLLFERLYRRGFATNLMEVVFVLLPLAMTMALVWKLKEVIVESVFGGEK